jgi:hypothetical protein
MLRHYRDLGVESFFVNVHLSAAADPVLEEVRAITADFGCGIASATVGPWQYVQQELYARQRELYPQDWFVLADQDELQRYPAGLVQTLVDCDGAGYDHLRGCFVDRVARNGALPPVDPAVPLGQQFPLGAFLSYPILQADPRKVVAVKGPLVIRKGQHHSLEGTACPARRHFIQVHHFKWVDGLAPRLAQRAAELQAQGVPHWVESARFVRFFEACGGRIPLTEPRLYVGECAPDYPHWNAVKDIALRLPRPGAD